jgi:hypothetical protein
MKLKIVIMLITTVTIFFSCKTPENEIQFEKNVISQIIPSIVDSICKDPRIFLNPPPMLGEFAYDKDNHVIIDTSLATLAQKIRYKAWLKQQNFFKKDTSKLILAFNPKISSSSDSLEVSLKKYFKRKALYNNSTIDSSYTLNLKEIKLNQHFEFKHSKEFTKSIDVWNKKYDFIFSGSFYVSRILFDESKNYGVLSASYTCGGLCGEGYIIYIKKLHGKWIIDNIEGTWIS